MKLDIQPSSEAGAYVFKSSRYSPTTEPSAAPWSPKKPSLSATQLNRHAAGAVSVMPTNRWIPTLKMVPNRLPECEHIPPSADKHHDPAPPDPGYLISNAKSVDPAKAQYPLATKNVCSASLTEVLRRMHSHDLSPHHILT